MTTDYLVVPGRLAVKYQRLQGTDYDVWADMTPKEVMMCRRYMVQRERQDAALEKWERREIDNSKG